MRAVRRNASPDVEVGVHHDFESVMRSYRVGPNHIGRGAEVSVPFRVSK